MLLLAFYVIHLVVVAGQPFVDGHEDNQQLKMLLRESREQNRRLESQMNRLKLVWMGLEKMCDVLSPTCTCESDSGTTSPPTPTANSTQKVIPLRVLTASSSGNETGEVTLTVTFTAPRVNSVDWMGVYYVHNFQNMIRSGKRESLGKGKYTSSLVLQNTESLSAVLVHVSAGNATVSLSFNIPTIGIAREQYVPELESPILDVQFTHTAPSDGDVNVTLKLQGTLELYEHLGAGPDVFFIGINSEEGTTRAFEIDGFSSDFLKLSGDASANDTLKFIVTVREPYAQLGGMVIVRIPSIQFKRQRLDDDLLKSLKYGHNMTLLPPDSKELYPANTVGLYEWQNQTMMVIPQQSLLCMAIGNPKPKIQMIRETEDGRRIAIAYETLYDDDWSAIVSHTLLASDRRTPGNYVCRAESGSAVSEERTEVLVYSPIIFDEAKTGVIKNNTKKVVFGCKAKGKQRPELQLRLYDADGPHLETFDNIKVKHTKFGKSGRRLTATMSPPNYDIHTVLCVRRILGGPGQYRVIELFPDDYRTRNWDLYHGNNYTNFYNATNIG